MKIFAVSILALGLIGGAASAYAGGGPGACHSISDSVYGIWGCR